ncbi:chemotaxis protein CheW [Stakelama marina]|uniref:Chemotaxis protein CheW n=1 Tax=Stakelama marina TaxID=2826939 RepID=A0A8T4I7K9_9SPHN|nr:chemotaxis protein CheW [Stakelama marina]MBR0550978.1 chemotaxis protein CheW [Stakelama marina]
MSTQLTYVTLGAGDEVFGVPVGEVQEILAAGAIARLPQMPRHLLGLIDIRGETVPVADLRRLLDLPDVVDGEQTRIVVLQFPADGQAAPRVGLRVDRVFEVTQLDSDTLEPPEAIGVTASRAIIGVGRRNGAFVTVLDFAALVGRDARKALAENVLEPCDGC